jgi:phosphatidylglycerophosphatase A
VATLFGVGAWPIAPGTWASLIGAGVGMALHDWSRASYLGLCAGLCVVAVAVAHAAERSAGTHDDPRIVIDELVGMLCAMAFVDRSQVLWVAGAFVLFRALDMLKPGPIGMLDRRVRGGLGVVLDDVAAGAVAACVLALLA